jgi:hypothetical protein
MSKIMEGISPLPWGYDPEIESLYSNIEGGDDFAMVDDLSHADAAYIVHAANLYPELVEALESIEQYGKDTLSGQLPRTMDDLVWTRDGVREMVRRASTVLAKCKAGAE